MTAVCIEGRDLDPDTVGVPAERLLGVTARDLTDPTGRRVAVFSPNRRGTVTVGRCVGVVEVDGTVIEVLPKVTGGRPADEELSRQTMTKLVEAYLETRAGTWAGAGRRLDPTRLEGTRGPIGERVYELFLEEAEVLLQKGVRSAYAGVAERLPYLRGRLDIGRQSRQLPGQDHLFHVRYRRFGLDRPENRLVKTALQRVGARSADPARRTRARQLAAMLDDVPVSHAVAADLALWDRGRLLVHYRPVEPWCRLVLEPLIGTRIGPQRAEAVLWRTERLFELALERAVARRLEATGSRWRLETQGRRSYLGTAVGDAGAFLLKPDLVLVDRERDVAVLDAKWKEQSPGSASSRSRSEADVGLDGEEDEEDLPAGVARVASSDAYQLFAYGHHFLGGRGPLVVVYPATPSFRAPSVFRMGGLVLWAVPYDVLADAFLLGAGPVPDECRDLWVLLSTTAEAG